MPILLSHAPLVPLRASYRFSSLLYFLEVGLALYGARCIGHLMSLVSCIQCFGAVISPRWASHMSVNSF